MAAARKRKSRCPARAIQVEPVPMTLAAAGRVAVLARPVGLARVAPVCLPEIAPAGAITLVVKRVARARAAPPRVGRRRAAQASTVARAAMERADHQAPLNVWTFRLGVPRRRLASAFAGLAASACPAVTRSNAAAAEQRRGQSDVGIRLQAEHRRRGRNSRRRPRSSRHIPHRICMAVGRKPN